MIFYANVSTKEIHGSNPLEQCNLDDARAAGNIRKVSFDAAALLRCEVGWSSCEHCLPKLKDESSSILESENV